VARLSSGELGRHESGSRRFRNLSTRDPDVDRHDKDSPVVTAVCKDFERQSSSSSFSILNAGTVVAVVGTDVDKMPDVWVSAASGNFDLATTTTSVSGAIIMICVTSDI
jgi:hypothetical protein